MPFGKHLNDTRDLMVVKRYQNRFMHKRRSVAEHMGSTAMIAHWIGVLEKELFNNNIDMSELMQRAINFNATQVWTGNVLSSTRKMSKAMSENMVSIKKITFDDYIKPTLPMSWRGNFERYIVYAKDSTIEGKILRAADILDTMLECVEEINLANKSGFERILKESALELISIDLNSVKYVIKYILPKFKLDLIHYGIDVTEMIDSIHFESIDSDKLDDFSVIGDYIYQYRNLMELLRYQNKHMYKRTSVAEHMWSVAKISQGLAIWTESKFGIVVDMANVLFRCLNHDVGELITGDILSTTKRMTVKMKEAVEEMEAVAFNKEIVPLIPKASRSEFETYVLNAKDDTIEGKILSAADIIDTIYECAGEVKLGNTEVFKNILQKVTESLIAIKLDAVDYFLVHSLPDIGLDIREYYGEEVYNYIESLQDR